VISFVPNATHLTPLFVFPAILLSRWFKAPASPVWILTVSIVHIILPYASLVSQGLLFSNLLALLVLPIVSTACKQVLEIATKIHVIWAIPKYSGKVPVLNVQMDV
jgi:hypothetical protein